MNDTDWPENVTARYLTVAGAHVEINKFGTDNRRTVSCNGCGNGHDFNGDPGLFGLDLDDREHNSLAECKSWAQAHASACRAMPRPAA